MRDETYLTTLIDRQQREGWSDNRMAREIGINPSNWNRIKRGQTGVGTVILRRIMTRFPEYNALAFLFLSSGATNGSAGRDDLKQDEDAA